MTSELPFFRKQNGYTSKSFTRHRHDVEIFSHILNSKLRKNGRDILLIITRNPNEKNQFKVSTKKLNDFSFIVAIKRMTKHLTGKERVQKMNELEEWETIYKEIVCNRITYFHFSHSLRFLFILAL